MEEIRELYRRLLDAWNTRNADGFAALFAPDAVMIGFDGSVAAGAEIHKHLAAIFADHTPATYVAAVREIRPLGTGAGLLHAVVGMVPPGGTELNPALNAHQVIVARGSAAGGAIELLQSTPAQYHGRPELADEHTAMVRAVLESGATLS